MANEKTVTKIYLLLAYAYRFNDKNCNEEIIVFLDLKSAVKAGKKILKEQLKELWKTDKDFDLFKNIGEYVNPYEEKASYVFTVREIEPDKIKSWQMNESTDDVEDFRNTVNNPLFIEWDFDYNGNLRERIMCRVDSKNRLSGGGWRWDDYSGVTFMPEDELPEAGTKFKLGDFVVEKQDGKYQRLNRGVYIIAGCPERDENGLRTENFYTCNYIDFGYFGYLNHDHLHESKLELYTGDVSSAYKWLSDVFAGRIKISEEDKKRIFNGEVNFAEEISYKDIKILK